MDSLDFINAAKRKGQGVRQEHPDGTRGAARRTRAAFVFLVAQDSSYITGEVIGVTGGRSLP